MPLDIDGVRRTYFALAENIEQIRRHERGGGASLGDGEIRFLAPLDNLLWRRGRLADLLAGETSSGAWTRAWIAGTATSSCAC